MDPGKDVDELARAVIGAAIDVHRELGPGRLEGVYEEAMARAFALAGIDFERQKSFKVSYKACTVGEGRIDFLVGGKLVVELKAIDKLLPIHKGQVISYLRGTSCSLGLLINFNENLLRMGVQRVVCTPQIEDRIHL